MISWSTFDQHFEWYLVHTKSTLDRYLDWHPIDTCSSVGRFTAKCWPTHWVDQQLKIKFSQHFTDVRPRCQLSINQVSIKCQPMCQPSIDQVLIEHINQGYWLTLIVNACSIMIQTKLTLENYTNPLRTPRTKLSMKNDPITTRE